MWFEIPTQCGLAYVQYTLAKDQWGALIRVLPGFFEQRPANVCELVKEQERFVTFFPLQTVVNRRIFDVVHVMARCLETPTEWNRTDRDDLGLELRARLWADSQELVFDDGLDSSVL